MARESSRQVVLFCLLILLQEFGHAHFSGLPLTQIRVDRQDAPSFDNGNGEKEEEKYDDDVDDGGDDDGDDDDDETADEESSGKPDAVEIVTPQAAAIGTSSKRVISWLPKLFKVVKMGGQILSHTSNMAGLANNIFRAITGCCVDFKDACEARDEFLTLKKDVTGKSAKADNLQLEVRNLQARISSNIEAFEDIVEEMERIALSQDRYLATIAPNLKLKLQKQDAVVQRFIGEKKAAKKAVKYLKMERMYNSAIVSAVIIAAPLLGLLMPLGNKLYEYCKAKQSGESTIKLERQNAIKMKNPPKTMSQNPRVKFSRYVGSTRRRNNEQLEKMRKSSAKKWIKANRRGKRTAKALGTAFNYFVAGINIYYIIYRALSCKDKRDKAIKARDDMREASKDFDEAIANITQAKGFMEQTFQDFRKNVTDERFLVSIENLKNLTNDITPPEDVDMPVIAADIQSFLDSIKEANTIEATYDLMDKLRKAIQRIPFRIGCLTNKAEMMQYVVEGCKKGTDTYSGMYATAKGIANVNNMNSCDGSQFIDEDLLKEGLEKLANEKKFNAMCEANNPRSIALACLLKNDGLDVDAIAEKQRVSKDVAKALIADCPKIKSLTPREERMVCSFRKKNTSNPEIAEIMGVNEDLVTKVNC